MLDLWKELEEVYIGLRMVRAVADDRMESEDRVCCISDSDNAGFTNFD